MQWKLPPRSRFAARYHEWAMRRGFPILLWIAPRFPHWLLRFGARAVIGLVMAAYPGPKAAIEKNLRRILGPAVSRSEIRRARREVNFHLALYWADLFRFGQLPYERSKDHLAAVVGLRHLEAALARKRGVVLLTAHLGNWELGGVFLREKNLPVSVVYVPDQSPTAEAFRAQLRAKIDIHEIPINPKVELSSLPVLRALKEGRVVALQGDRDLNDRGEWVDFFGAPAPFPMGPILLARMTGATLVPIFIVYDERHHFEIHFDEPILVEEGDRATATRRALERWVKVLEKAVARWPTQWYTFYDFWEAGEKLAEEAEPAVEREAV
ncbi:MAG TPA: lysophospholipid acyltransferase family protein [Thermoanaerobaculia bacterium]|nr:lysophospholipid acyltransferase family protein [Thermoanaerobaculia bacterium]